MDLAHRQAVVVRLAVDAELRSRFFASPADTAPELGVTPAEAEDLAATVQGLPQFARSLLRKRLGEVRRLLPRTAELLGARFDAEFLRFAASRPSSGPRRHERDALAFAEALRPEMSGAERSALLRETGWIEAETGRRFVVRRLGGGALAVWVRTGRTVRHWSLGTRDSWTNTRPGAQESE